MSRGLLINKYLFLSLLFFCISVAIGLFGLIDVSIVLLIIACFFEILFIKCQPLGYASVSSIFIIFSIIYGLSGPISQRWLGGISEIFGNVFDLPSYIIAFSLSEIGLILGYAIYLFRHETTDIVQDRVKNYDVGAIEFLRRISTVLIIIGVVFQLINTIRIGGFDTIFMDKAYYQAAEAALTMTLPANAFIEIAFACLGLYVGLCRYYKVKIKVRTIVLDIVLSVPYFMILLLLGQRGRILTVLVIVLLSLTMVQPIRKISKKALLLIALVYFSFAFMFTNRGIVQLLKTDSDDFFSKITNVERYEDGLNPGKSELSCTFGNFNKLIIEDDYEYKYGKTYLDGLALSIPSFLYVGEKPKQITYEFRDRYFYEESKRSDIAGTAFSSILEAYWNFGYIGILVMFTFYGYFVVYLDYSLSKKSIMKALFVIVCSGALITFPRTQLGSVIAKMIYDALYIVILVYIPYVFYRRKLKKLEKISVVEGNRDSV